MMPIPPTTLLEAARHRAAPDAGTADRPSFTYLNDGEHVGTVLTYAQLDQRARALAAHLQALAQPGDRVLLVYPPGMDYIVAFYACVYAGMVAVPALSPSSARTLPRLRLIAADAQPRVALTQSALRASMEQMHDLSVQDDPLRRLHWLSTDDLSSAARPWVPPQVQPTDLVFLQYTSGSTGAPKGVMVSHAHLLANVALAQQAYGVKTGDVFVSWLPPHHDFGLIGAIIFPLCTGCHSVQFPPASFLMRPYRWLKAISDYRARITGAPNFAYQLCVQRIPPAQRQQLDLSSLQVAVNGAERIRPATLRQFAAAFAECGLRPDALTPSYGMAESVLVVSAAPRRAPGEPPHTRRLLPSALEAGRVETAAESVDALEVAVSGSAQTGDHRVAIVDPTTQRELPDNRVGEVWVQGPSVAGGYWGRAEESEQAFGATLAGRPGRWLRSGDLGFLCTDELYITGRIKEVMIFNGRNVYPQDVEATVEALDPAFRANGCAAFSLEEGETARLVIVQEIEARQQPTTEDLVIRLRTELAERHEIVDLAAVLLVRPGRIPRTSSGKIQRLRCRQLYLGADIDSVWSWTAAQDLPDGATPTAPRNPTEARLLALWQAAFDRTDLSTTANFFLLGGHSLLAARLITEVRATFQVDVPLRTLFHAPTIVTLAREIDEIGTPLEPALPPIGPASAHDAAQDTAPLSYAQQRFWFLDQYQPGNPFYTIPLALTLHGPVDTGVLQQALSALVARHAPLRTVFEVDQGVPRQVIHPATPVLLTITELADTEQVQAAIAQEAGRPFDLRHGPLLRASLLRGGPDRQVLLLTVHHIVFDGGSVPLLLNELMQLYAAHRLGPSVSLPALAVQYADCARWEQRHFSGTWLDARLAYWRASLADAPALLAWATDRPRPAVMTHRGAAYETRLPAALVQRLAALGRQHNATLFAVLAAGLNVLLHRCTGQPDFCIGLMSANRPAGTEALIGNFVNVVPLRCRMPADPGFLDVLAATTNHLLEAYDRQLPFELILQHVAPQRSAAYTPYTQVVINFHSELDTTLAAPRWEGDQALQIAGRHPASVTHAAFELKLEITQTGDSLALVYEYNADLLDATTVSRLAARFETLLDAAAAAPAGRIRDLALLTPAELAALRQRWQHDVAEYPRDRTVGELFAAQAARTPDAVALVHPGGTLTYRELDRRSNRLARRLQALGVQPDTRVGLCVERSPDMVVGLLAVLKAGGAYVPLDPTYPRARLQFMAADACPRVLLTQQHLAATLPDDGLPVLVLDTLSKASPGTADEAPVATPGHSGHLAYVIYTSGSTGQPKGAMVTRQGFMNLLCWYAREFDVQADDKVLLFSSFSFDLTQKNLVAPLLAGAQLHLPADGYDPEAARRHIALHGITRINCAPSAFYPLLGEDGSGVAPLASLRHVCLGGEPIHARRLHEAFATAASVPKIHNTYGPTEASDVVSFHTWDPRTPRTSLPIGRAIANTRLYVLDTHQQLLPQGSVGELYIGGDGVGRGYLHRSELTALRFVPDPHAGSPDHLMYRTGDLARELPDGELEYLGRLDHQVKIRGLRIELGEIEAALEALPAIAQAVVLVRDDHPPGDPQLVAYVVAAGVTEPLDAASVRSQLSRHLPQFMLPAHVVPLAALPLTPSGKVDRQALTAPMPARTDAPIVAPVSTTEQVLCRVWAEVLKREQAGATDDFFHLGGHSLLATQLVSKLRTALGVEVTVRALFEHPTPRALAQHLETPLATRHQAGPQPHLGDSDTPAPLSFAQQRLWFLEQWAPGQPVYNLPHALRLHGALDVAALQRSFDAVAQRHQSLRTGFSLIDGEAACHVVPTAPWPLQVIDLQALPPADTEEHARRLMAEEARRPFDLHTPPLARVMLLRLAPQHHLLLVNLHHLIADGWSLGVLMAELDTLYRTARGEPVEALPPLPLQYADFTRWQRQGVNDGDLTRQLDYWRGQLQGAPAELALPTDRPRPAVPSHRGATLRFELPAPLTAALQDCVQARQATLFMGLAAAFGLLLSRHTGQNDLCIGTPIANRQHAALEGLIGFFVNTLVLRLQPQHTQSFDALLAEVRDTALGAYAHQDLPFDQLVAAVDRQHRHSPSPLFQAMLALQNAPTHALALQDLRCEPVAVDTGTAKFDLTLVVEPVNDRLVCSFEYRTDLFDAGTIERLAQGLVSVIEQAVQAPAQPLNDRCLLPSAQRLQLLRLGQGAATGAPRPTLIHTAFEAWASTQPDAPALLQDAQIVSYAELNRRANRLAYALIDAGVRPDARVALYLERGIDLVVSVLAVLKAGGAYAALDPAYPDARLSQLVQDCAPVALVTQAARLDDAHRLGLVPVGRPCLQVDDPARRATAAAVNPEPAALRLAGHHLAYIVYTSGSTGVPKGVLIEHAGLCNLAQDQNTALGLGPGQRMLQFASPSFDASTWEFVLALCSGAALVLAPREALLPGEPLIEMLLRHRVTHALLPPSALALASDDGRLPPMTLIVGGEACPPAVVQHWGTRHRLFNAYGPSEITVCATIVRCEPRPDGLVPIGRPIANTCIHLLDEAGQLVPQGAVGEIHIGGAGVARGYLNRTQLTAERFLRDPFSAQEGARLYKTGDLGRWLPDGQLHYLGRNDFQVKIRGFRIELGEIETRLREVPGVADAVVIAREDSPGHPRLVAYLRAGSEPVPAAALLRSGLQAHLPDHMVPSAFVTVDAWPLTPHGKLDRHALPAPGSADVATRAFEAPAGPVETELAALWCELLEIDTIGRFDQFFELGGHSLAMTRLGFLIQERFNVTVSVRQLYELQALHQMAQHIEQTRQPNGRTRTLVLDL